MKNLKSEYANLYKSLCSTFSIKHHSELKGEELKSFSSKLKQKWQSITSSKKKKKSNKQHCLTIVMLQSWKRRLIEVLNDLYEKQLIVGYNGDVGPTELTVVVYTKLSQDELLETLRDKLDFSGYLNIHKSTESEMRDFG